MSLSTAASPASTHTIPSGRRSLSARHATGVRQIRTHAPAPSTRPAAASTKRTLDIEEALSWAFRHELTKRREDDHEGPRLGFSPISPISPMFRVADLGVRIENFSREPGMPMALGEPHPDALLIEAAVLGLARYAGHRFEGDLGLCTYLPAGLDDRAAMARAMRQIVSIVQVYARLGSRPAFSKSPEPAAIVGRNGKPLVQIMRTEMRADRDGILRPHQVAEACGAEGKDRYPRGAFCPIAWDDFATILLERADYAAWWAGVDLLAHELNGQLATIAVLPPAAGQRPWAGDVDAGKPGRVLDSPASRAKLRDQQVTYLARRLLAHRRRSSGARRRASGPGESIASA